MSFAFGPPTGAPSPTCVCPSWVTSVIIVRTLTLCLTAIAGQESHHVALAIEIEDVVDDDAGLSTENHAEGLNAREHLEQFEMQPRRLQPAGEIVTDLAPSAELPIDAIQSRDA